jgi:hypothetical protein
MLLDDAYLDSSDLVDLPDVDVPAREQQRLRDAINGRGAFARFRRELDRAGEDLHDQWLAFREERMLGRARAWLAVEGYTASVS